MSTGELVSSNQRPIPLSRRPDLQMADIDYLGVGYCVIKDPVGLKYHRLQVEQYRVLELLNGERSLEQVRDGLKESYPTLQVTLSDVQQLISDLHKKGLVYSNRPGQGAAVTRTRKQERNQKIKQTMMSLLYLRLPGWDPEQSLKWMYPFTKWVFSRFVVTFCCLFVVSSWLLLAVNFETFTSKLPEFQTFFGWPNLMYMWITLGIAKIIHEFGHGLSCHHYGRECHEMGVMLLVFSPCLYCDVTDSWMLRSKWQRIIIGAAGMYIEIILSAIAIYVWWFTKPSLLHHLALNIFFVTTITTVIFNANPLMRFDGYYMMSDFLEIPNLRQKSDKMLREAFSWYCLGIESRPDPFMPETGKVWFIAYAIAAWLYRWVILASISLFLYTVLKPYDLQSIGITLMFVSMAGIFFAMFKNIYQIIATPRLDPMSKPKIFISLVVFSGLIYLVANIPVPWWHEAPFLLEPSGVSHVPVRQSGRLLTPAQYRMKYEKLVALEAELDDFVKGFPGSGEASAPRLTTNLPEPDEFTKIARPHDKVEKDQILAIVEDPADLQKLDEMVQLSYQWKGKFETNSKFRNAERYDRSLTLEADIAELTSRINEILDQLRTRVIYAPVAGTVVAPPRQPEPKISRINRRELHRWHGTPIDEENENCFVEAGTRLLSIAPEVEKQQLQAVMYIDQGDRDDLHRGKKVDLKLDALPGITYIATVTQISPGGDLIAPEALTTNFGGPLGTVAGQGGQQEVTSTLYRAIAPLPLEQLTDRNDRQWLIPGMRGTARIPIEKQTTWQLARTYFYETFRFRL